MGAMDHIGDIAQLIFALVAVASFIRTLSNGRKTDQVAKDQIGIKNDMRELALNTNSIKDALVTSTAKASLAEGTAIGLAQGRAEGINGKND